MTVPVRNRFALAVVSIACLGSCKVGPDYHAPVLQTPAAWQAPLPDAAAAAQDRGAWWREFHDPMLNALVARALAGNEPLKVAVARIIEVRGLRESTAGKLYPQLGGSTSVLRGDPGVPTLGGDLTQYGAEFDAAWELDLFGGTRREMEAQDALIGARQAAYRNASLSLAAEVVREYILLRQYQAQLAITRQTANLQRHLYAITQDHYNGGLVSTLDVSQAATLYKTTAARLPDFERQITASSYRLSLLLGEAPGGLKELADHAQPIPDAQQLPVLAAPAEILRQRPDVAEAERNLAAATALQGVAISALYPKVSLAALFGIQRGDLPILHYIATENIWTAGASISMPILEFGSIRGQIKAADARQVQAFHQYQQTVLAALSDVDTDLSNLANDTRHHAMLKDAGASAEHAVKVARDRYRSGLSDFTSVLQAEQQDFSVQLDLIAAESTVAQDVIALHKAIGIAPEGTAPQ